MDFLAFLSDPRRYIWENRAREQQGQARELALSLAELQDLADRAQGAAGPSDATGSGPVRLADHNAYLPDLPRAAPPQFGGRETLEQLFATSDAGYKVKDIADAASEAVRSGAFSRAATGLARNPYALGNLANKLDVSPVREGGGVLFDRFAGDITAVTPAHEAAAAENYAQAGAASALAGLRGAQTADTRMRTGAVRSVLNDPGADLYTRANAANKRTLGKSERVVVQTPEGVKKYVDAVLTPSGWRYSDARDTEGQLLVPPPEAAAGRDSRTAMQKNSEFIARTFGVSDDEALSYLVYSRSQKPADAWQTMVRDVVRVRGSTTNPQRIRDEAAALWGVVRGSEPLPAEATLSAPTPAPVAPLPAPRQPAALPGTAPRAATPASPDTPPLPGARKSPKDGRWYVQKDGRWHLVEP